jgi:hypothetical protein
MFLSAAPNQINVAGGGLAEGERPARPLVRAHGGRGGRAIAALTRRPGGRERRGPWGGGAPPRLRPPWAWAWASWGWAWGWGWGWGACGARPLGLDHPTPMELTRRQRGEKDFISDLY